jgi:6-phosphogluconolactonase (cycloisomerase 2 family)
MDPTGRFAYVPNANSNNVSAYAINTTTGALSPVPGSFAAGTGPIYVAVDPTGRFAYVPNETSNNVSAYGIDSTTGALSPVPGSPFAAGSASARVTLEPTGRFAYVLNANSNNVSAYGINTTTGALSPVPGSPFAAGANPAGISTGIRYLPDLNVLPCAQEQSLKSLTGTTLTSIVFINSSPATRKVYWLDYSGLRVLYAALPSGASYIQGTFLTHPWVITDSADACIGIYLPIDGMARVDIK